LREQIKFLVFLVLFSWFSHPLARAGQMTLPAGTQLQVVLETTLNTKKSKVGDPFQARLVVAVWSEGREILPVGTSIEGIVVSMKAPGRVKGRAFMQLRPDTLYLPDGRDIELGASLQSAKNEGKDLNLDPKEGTVKSDGKSGPNARKIAEGVGIGGAVGAGVGGASGAAIGAGAAASVAVLHQVFKKGKDAEMLAGTELMLEVTRSVSFSDMQEVPPGTRVVEGTIREPRPKPVK
jgi:hypothetical protein